MLIAGVAFVAIVTMILGIYWVFVLRVEHQEDRTLTRRLKSGPRRALIPAMVARPVERMSAVHQLDSALTRWQAASRPVRTVLMRSHVNMTVGGVVLTCAFAGMVAFVVVFAATRSIATALGGIVLAAALPILYLRRVAHKRLLTFEEQFPEAIDLLARALRAGHALTNALQMVGGEVPDPVGEEFRELFEHQNFGMSLPEALGIFATRVPLVDARFFVTAVLTQRETGGNLSQVLDRLSGVIRERFRVKGQVRVISAHGRMTGYALAALPPTLAALLLLISPTHIRLLIDDPIGVDMVIAAIVLQTVGVLFIRRIVRVEY
jgi:tight adherence protein B